MERFSSQLCDYVDSYNQYFTNAQQAVTKLVPEIEKYRQTILKQIEGMA